MNKDESDAFQKLLSEASAAPDADTLTVYGILGRTADKARFTVTLANGRCETLDVAAVKSAKKIAGAVGQAVVELQLDAKRVPENLRTQLTAPFAAATPHQADAATIGGMPFFGSLRTWFTPWDWGSDFHHVYSTGAQAQPFVSAMAHQAQAATMGALSFFNGPRTYFTPYDWAIDHTGPILKTHVDNVDARS
jgi:hypothetical protein